MEPNKRVVSDITNMDLTQPTEACSSLFWARSFVSFDRVHLLPQLSDEGYAINIARTVYMNVESKTLS